MDRAPALFAVFIPIIAIAGAYLIAIVAIFHNLQKKRLKHQENMAIIARGEIPPVAVSRLRSPQCRGFDPDSAFRSGVTTATAGAAWFLGFMFVDAEAAGLGLVPLFIGIGLVAFSMIARRELLKYEA